jgi:hypothetical protein
MQLLLVSFCNFMQLRMLIKFVEEQCANSGIMDNARIMILLVSMNDLVFFKFFYSFYNLFNFYLSYV